MSFGSHETYTSIDQDVDNTRYQHFLDNLRRAHYDRIPTRISWNQIGYEHSTDIETDNRVQIMWHDGSPIALTLQTRDDYNYTDNVLVHFGIDALSGRQAVQTTTEDFADLVKKIIEAEGLYGARPGISEHVFQADVGFDDAQEDCHLFIVWLRSKPISLSLEVRTNPESPIIRHAFFGRGRRV